MHKLYLVEDEPLELEALEMILTKNLKEVEIVGTAASGGVALKGILETKPNIVIMDINIPEINGIEVLRRIKKTIPDTKVILITAFNEFDFAHQAIKARVDDFLLKPIRPNQLVEAVNQTIESLISNKKNWFDDKKNEVLYGIVQKKYSYTKQALGNYLDALYENNDGDLISIQREIGSFIEELAVVARDVCGCEIKSNLKNANNQQQFIKTYKNKYNLKVDIMKIIDRIFDDILEEKEDKRNNIEEILNYIDKNCRKDISLDQVGEYANMSSYYLSKIFKKETGMNFVTYLTERKIELARDMLLNTDIPIINIALDLSYHEPNYFSKVFKKSTGLTPTEYRRKMKQK